MNDSLPTIAIIGGVFLILLLIFAYMPFAIVPAGTIGIQDTFGQVDDHALQSGFYFKNPITQIIPINMQTQKYVATASSASKDLQDVQTEVTLNYHLDSSQATKIYKEVGLNYQDKVIVPAIQESVKSSTAEFTADNLITKRPQVKQAVEEILNKRLANYGIIVETISITNFQFSEDFTKAVELKVTAEQKALQSKNDLERIKIEKEQQITQAQARAEAVKLDANAQAYSTRIKADADAYALKQVKEQLVNSPTLIEYKSIEKWDGKVPVYSGSGIVPFLNISEEVK